MNTLFKPASLANVKRYYMLLLLVLVFVACGNDDDTGAAPLPSEISFEFDQLFPEGFDYDENTREFFVSSISQGDIFKVNERGEIARFTSDENLISSTGVTIDRARNRIIVCSADVNASVRSTDATAFITTDVGIYDLNSGSRISFFQLGGLRNESGHFASEAAVDDSGNIYVTDSFGPFIFKIDTEGNTSVFLEDADVFTPSPNAFGLNGLVYHPDGYLIAAKSDEGKLFKIPIDNPENYSLIETEAVPGVDGIALDGNNNLLLAINATNQVVRVTTNDQWSSATTSGSFSTPDVFPSMVNTAGAQTFVLHSYINRLLAGESQSAFQLQEVTF